MTEKVAVVGSRNYPDLDRVRFFLDRLHRKHPTAIVVSGGARGVDETAEKHWLGLGGRVISFRPYENTPESFWVQELGLASRSDVKPYAKFHREPSWANYESALLWRNNLIMAACTRAVYFMSEPPTVGTSHARDCAKAEGKPIYDGGKI